MKPQAGRAQNSAAVKPQSASPQKSVARQAEPQAKQAAKSTTASQAPQQKFYAKPSQAVKQNAGFKAQGQKPAESNQPKRQVSGPKSTPVAKPERKKAQENTGGGRVINPDPLDRPSDDPEGFKFSDWLRSWRESQERN
ncbi:hypothetical protein [Corynebacterium lowii]|uniref:hypothetical protein n=1 Tax=Corynebacterium lowii TaxID=1544413 RepID=UPI0012E16599|nr:hypothetical protein [Corynebacterium lowii]MDP9851499.1 DNA replication initiation complex subunit (GINS family) [Corynebacterium lowii]